MNAPDQEQQPTENTSASFGERIRQAREERQLSIDDLVGETRINPQHLIDLEECKTSGISAPGYIVGYLRTLAKVLDLDAEELISDFKSSIDQADHQTIDPEHELLPPKAKKNSFGWSTILATTIIVLAGLGALIYYWVEVAGNNNSNSAQSETADEDSVDLGDSGELSSSPNQAPDSSRSSDQSSTSGDGDLDVGEGALTVSSDGRSANETNGNSNSAGVETSPELTGSASPRGQTSTNWEDLMNLTQGSPMDDATDVDANDNDEPSVPVDTPDSEETDQVIEEEPPLLFEFSDVSFVEVTDADDNQLVSETKDAGTKLELDGTEPFTIKLGSASGVTVFFKGDKVDLTPHTRRNIAEFTLPP